MDRRVQRILTWDRFKTLLRELRPKEIYYAQGLAPLARPPVELRLTFTDRRAQYVFIDTAEAGILRRTKLPVSVDKYGNFLLKDEDIREFIYSELGRDDVKVRSFELMGGY
jgi:hypothetical protein